MPGAPLPVVIDRLVDALVAAAKAQGVHGSARVRMVEVAGERVYRIVLDVPASETVMTRAPKR